MTKSTRNLIISLNKKFLRPLAKVSNSHKLLSKCFLGTGHYDLEFYSEKVNRYFWALEAKLETSQLLRIAEKHFGLIIAFDFNFVYIRLICPTYDKPIMAAGLCDYKDTLYIAGRRSDPEITGTLAHEICHWAVYCLYNSFEPYRINDSKRKKEYWTAIQECGRVYKNKEFVNVDKINTFFALYGRSFLHRTCVAK